MTTQANWGLPEDAVSPGPVPVTPVFGGEGGVMGGTGRREDPVLGVFFYREVHNKEKSEIEGRAVFDSVPYIRIMCPGDTQNIVERPVKEPDKQRFPVVWQAFCERKEGVVEGTPIEELAILTRKQIAVLKHKGVMTVEMLAGVSDDKLDMSLTRDLRKRAQQFLAGSSETEKELRRELAEAKKRLHALEQVVARLTPPRGEASGAAGEPSSKPRRKSGRSAQIDLEEAIAAANGGDA